MKAPKKYIATIQILVEAYDESEAADGIHTIMDESEHYDWWYVQFGSQYLHPTEFHGKTPIN